MSRTIDSARLGSIQIALLDQNIRKSVESLRSTAQKLSAENKCRFEKKPSKGTGEDDGRGWYGKFRHAFFSIRGVSVGANAQC